MDHNRLSAPVRLCLTVALAGVGLAAAGCDRGAPGEIDIAIPSEAELRAYRAGAPVDDLPGGDPAPVGVPADGQDYGWIEDAYYLNHAFDDSAPDYAYGYDDTEWWGWESEDGWRRVVEPLAGSDRYYYYRPGDERPFYVMDDGYGYGFSNGVLQAVYDRSGASQSREFVRSRSDYAGRYLRRAREARAARQTARRWQVADARWESRQDRFAAEQARLERAAQQQVPWRDYRRALERTAPPERLRLDRERARRQALRAERRGEALTPAGPPPPVSLPNRPGREDRTHPGKGREKSEAAHARNAKRKADKAWEKAERKRARDEDKATRRND